MVLLNLFHLMAWPRLTDTPEAWPVSSRYFEPEQGPAVYEQYLQQMVLADELGFDWVACNEHHFSPFGLMASPSVMGAALSQRVTRSKIALLGSLPTLTNPVRVAEEYAMLDQLSGGRLVAGLLRGGAIEYLAYGVNTSESRERFEEAVELILKCWTEPEPFGWEGRYYQYRTVSIWPRPVQQPHPPVYMGGFSEQSARFAVKHHFGIGHGFAPIFVGKKAFETYRRIAAEQGWTPPPESTLFDEFIYVHPTSSAEARRVAQEASSYFNERLNGPTARILGDLAKRELAQTGSADPEMLQIANMRAPTVDEQIAGGTMCVGTPDEVVEQLSRVVTELDLGVLSARFQMGSMAPDIVQASMRLFMQEVWPHVRHLGAGANRALAATSTA